MGWWWSPATLANECLTDTTGGTILCEVSRARKILTAARNNPAGLRFSELQRLSEAAGFVLDRINGDHFVYVRHGIADIINLQPIKGGKAKPYQVRQVLALIDKYDIEIE